MVELSIEDLSRQTYRFLGGNGTVGPNFNSQFVIVGYLLYTGVFYKVVYLENRSINAVYSDGSDRSLSSSLALLRSAGT